MGKVKLSPEVAEKFDCKAKSSVVNTETWGTIDFEKLTLKKAEKLVLEGYPNLVRKKVKNYQNSPPA